jgi:hypothetical protein
LRQVFFLWHNHPDKAAFTALHLILIHRPNISGFRSLSQTNHRT